MNSLQEQFLQTFIKTLVSNIKKNIYIYVNGVHNCLLWKGEKAGRKRENSINFVILTILVIPSYSYGLCFFK